MPARDCCELTAALLKRGLDGLTLSTTLRPGRIRVGDAAHCDADQGVADNHEQASTVIPTHLRLRYADADQGAWRASSRRRHAP